MTMKRFIFLQMFLTLFISAGKSQTIDYKNPLWAFDYMRAAWENNVDFFEVENVIQMDSSHVDDAFRDYYGQALMTVQTFNGKIVDKDRTNALFRHRTEKLKQSESLSEDIRSMDAGKFILENFSDEKIIMFNEAHLYPQHRAFINSLLSDLYQKGYRHLFMEALSAEQAESKYPEREMGIYTNEPCMANLVRNAIRKGFRLHAYDGYDLANRDSASAENIFRVVQENPEDKFIVICGFDHNNEKRSRSLASYLKQVAQINPLTIDLTVYSEPESSNHYNELIAFYHVDYPSVLVDCNNDCIAMKNASGRDLYVIFPHTTYIHGYPQWMINRHENKWEVIHVADFDVAKVYMKEELEHGKSPIPYSFKYQNDDKNILVPQREYVIRYYKSEDGCLDLIGYYDSSDMTFRNVQSCQ